MRVWCEISETLGQEVTNKLAQHLAGQTRRVPIHPNPWWIDRLGAEHANAVCNKLGGEVVTIPSSRARHASIFEARAKGLSINEIATSHYIHERTVRRILKDAPKTQDA